jgi:hypothetical protein
MEQPFFLLHPLHYHCATMLAIIELPRTAALVTLWTLWHHPELRTDTVNSLKPLAGTLGYSSGRSPVRTCRSSTSSPLASLVSLLSPPNPQRSPYHRGLLLDRCSHDHRLARFCQQAADAEGGERSPGLGLGPKGPFGMGRRKPGRPSASVCQAHCYSGIFLLPFD